MTSYKHTFVPQIDARDCGVAALASIAKFYGSDFSSSLERTCKDQQRRDDCSWHCKAQMKWDLKQGLFKQIKRS